MIKYIIYIRKDKHRQHGPVPANLTQCVYNNDIRGANWRSSRDPRRIYIIRDETKTRRRRRVVAAKPRCDRRRLFGGGTIIQYTPDANRLPYIVSARTHEHLRINNNVYGGGYGNN